MPNMAAAKISRRAPWLNRYSGNLPAASVGRGAQGGFPISKSPVQSGVGEGRVLVHQFPLPPRQIAVGSAYHVFYPLVVLPWECTPVRLAPGLGCGGGGPECQQR